MKIEPYNYRSGEEVIPNDVRESVLSVFRDLKYNLEKYSIKDFKKDLFYQLKMKGWSGNVILSTNSKISITSIWKDIGLCIQTGNMARIYADILKLQSMYIDQKIKAAIFVIPTKDCAKSFGDNIANSSRFLNELNNIYYNVITVPMFVICFDNEENA